MNLRQAEREMGRMLSTAIPIGQHERIAALCRPLECRTPFPEPGEVVWYRHEPFGQLSEATVEQVDTSNPRDTYVWAHTIDPETGYPVRVEGKYVMEMVLDPWPDVYLRTRWGRIVTREARIEGSPGWLPRGGE